MIVVLLVLLTFGVWSLGWRRAGRRRIAGLVLFGVGAVGVVAFGIAVAFPASLDRSDNVLVQSTTDQLFSVLDIVYYLSVMSLYISVWLAVFGIVHLWAWVRRDAL